MKGLVKALDNLPRIVKLILTFIWGIFPNLMRFAKSIAKGNVLGVILSIILLICGGFLVLWIIDIVTMVLWNKIYWID